MLDKLVGFKKDWCDRQGQFAICLEHGNCYQKLSNYTEAIGFYEQCKEVGSDSGNQAEGNWGIINPNIGICYFHKELP